MHQAMESILQRLSQTYRYLAGFSVLSFHLALGSTIKRIRLLTPFRTKSPNTIGIFQPIVLDSMHSGKGYGYNCSR